MQRKGVCFREDVHEVFEDVGGLTFADTEEEVFNVVRVVRR